MNSGNLVYKVYDMLLRLGLVKTEEKGNIMIELREKIRDVNFLSKLVSWLEMEFNFSNNDYGLRRSLCDLIDNINYVKQCIESCGIME